MGALIENLKETVKYPFLKIPYFKKIYEAYTSCPWYPGHFYSTIPSLEDVQKNKRKIFENGSMKGININEEKQFRLLQHLKDYYPEIPFEFNPNTPCKGRYQSKDAYYRFSDVVCLYSIIRHFNPQKIIEVGSGHSSAVMLDTNEIHFNNKIQMDFIEPYPEERLLKILRYDDSRCVTVHKAFVQEIEVGFFKKLCENDILFIDSSHVSKVGSDVNYLFFEIFPELQPGVLIHIHDIFYPFELPSKWVLKDKCFWNEIYLLRAFLMNNNDYEIILFNSFMQKKHSKWFQQNMPVCLREDEYTGSMWLRKLR